MVALRAAGRAVGALGWALVSLAALAGLLLSAGALYATSPPGRRVVAGAIVRYVDDALAGRFELEGITVLPQGGVEVRGLRVFDPEERLVLAVDRARLFADVTRLRAGELGLVAELDGPTVLLEEDPDGGLSLSRAFGPARPRVLTPEEEPDGPGLSVRVSRVVVRGGAVWWVDAEGETRLEASGLDLDARGLWASRNASAELRLHGELAEPVEGAVALEAALSRDGDALHVPLLVARLGGTAVELTGYGDLAARTGRAAVRRFEVDRGEARALVPAAGAGADLEGWGYAEADGRTASVAVSLSPRDARAPGRADLAAAIALVADRPTGFDVALDRVDPSRLHAAAPAGEVTLAARGAFQGEDLAALRGHLELALSPSRLREGRLGPATVSARAAGGTVRVERLALRAPGLQVSGSGSWREGGAVSGTLGAEAADLAVALANAGAALGERLPAAAGRLRVTATLSGTSARPALAARVESASLAAFDVAVRALALDVELSGPAREASGRVSGRIGALATGGAELARALSLEGEVAREEARLDVHAAVPSVADDRVALELRGSLGPRRETLRLAALALAYPGARWTLSAPATVRFEGPTVDRLELASGGQRIAVEGGLGKRGAIAARVEGEAVDLARLPRGLLPEGLAGVVSLDASVAGTTARPVIAGRVSVARGAWRTLAGLDARGEVRLDAGARRLVATVAAERARGGAVEMSLDGPWPLRGGAARAGALAARVTARDLPVEELLALAELDVAAEGLLSADLRLGGTMGAPRLEGELRLADGAYDDLFPIAARVGLANAGDRLEVELAAEVDGRPALTLDAAWPLSLSRALETPGERLAELGAAPLEASARVPGFPLDVVAGTLGLPRELAGVVEAEASLTGSVAAPRGRARATLEAGALAGYRRVDAAVSADLGAGSVAVAGGVAVAGAELATFRGSLGAAPEKLLDAAALGAAPLSLDVTVPEGTLARASSEALPLTGTLRGALRARGSLAAPEVEVTAAGSGVQIQGRRLGEASVEARYARARTDATVELRGATGGTARITARLDAPLGLGADLDALGGRPVEVRLRADALDLGIVPALAPGLVRSASGRLDADVVARGPLARPSPRGTLTVTAGRLAVSEYGDWTDVTVDASVTDDAVEVRSVRARRGAGSLEASASLRGLAAGRARLEGKARTEALTIVRAGMPLATFDLEATATGSYADDRLEAVVRLPRGVVRLPDRLPRELQELEQRPDIVIGRPEPKRRKVRAASAAPVRPLAIEVRLVAPDQLFVRSENPRVDLELEADVTYELVGGESYAQGSVEVIRGYVEPIGGRTFQVERGRVQFTGGPPTAALLDVQARYDNPAAQVTVVLTGPVLEPEIRLSSQPPMDEGQIAMLIATGRAEMKAGSGGVGTITGEEAGLAALSALATRVFKDLVADKLPLDTVALDAGALRAGKYVTDKIYVGYTRRFEADPERGENADEVRVEYQITPRWTFESRYGSAQSGGASLIWSKDY